MSLKPSAMQVMANKQQGFLLPLAIFIVVVMGVFALVVARNSIQTSSSAVQELTSVQAFYAAESGAQRAMQSLFFNADLTRQAVDGRCAALATTYNFNVTGLNNCSAAVSCQCQFQDASNCVLAVPADYSAAASVAKLTSYYTIVSTATCGAGNLSAQRTINAGAFLLQE